MIFVDSNVVMYLTGAPHPNKDAALAMVQRLVDEGEAMVTSAEVLQEVLHRFVAIGRRDAIRPTLDVLVQVVDEVESVGVEDVLHARDLVLGSDLTARDALHVAVMRRLGVDTIATFDRNFDAIPGITRIAG